MTALKWIGVLCWMVFALTPAIASSKSADLGVSFTVQPSTFPLPNSVGSVTVTVTNYGPDTVSAVGVHSSNWEDGKQILLFRTPDTQCDFGYGFYDGPTPLVYAGLLFNSAPLPPGAQESCTVGITVYQNATGQYPLYFTVSPYELGVVDPNPRNNQSPTVTLFLSPIAVPALTTFALVLMAVLIALIAALWFREKLRDLGR